jgi:hypothetical protein
MINTRPPEMTTGMGEIRLRYVGEAGEVMGGA